PPDLLGRAHAGPAHEPDPAAVTGSLNGSGPAPKAGNGAATIGTLPGGTVTPPVVPVSAKVPEVVGPGR
ncbi:hypothetical protein CS379_09450, partial [Methylobacterium frigidaeris]